jgi:hypothetical protein
VSTGFVSPESDARTFNAHAAPDEITRTAFVEADPLVDHASVGEQLSPMKQIIFWLSGPCSVNIPTVKLNFVASPPGELLQHKV